MADYIARDAVRQAMRDPVARGIHFTEYELDKIPMADVAPVRHAAWVRWSDDKFMGYGADGKLKYRKCYSYECYCGHKSAVKTNYCPNCGAKMDLEVSDG